MKARISYFFISGLIILFIFIGIFIWRNKHLKEIPNFNEKSFTVPISSKYIPTNADLVFHWKINPNILPNYLENYENQIKSIRDTSFRLISLDFSEDISKWVGGHGSFAIFGTNNQLVNDWIMVLETSKNINIDEAMELIKGQNFINENVNSVNKSNISKSKVISKKINSNESIYFLDTKDHILISSNLKIIENSIIQSGIDTSNKKEIYKNIQLKDNVNNGFLLLEIASKKIFNLLEQEDNLLTTNQTDKLISSINIDKKNLILDGVISYSIKNKIPINEISYDLTYIEKELNYFDNFILIDNPKKYFGESSNYPYQKLIASVIKNSTTENYSNLFKIILENNKGNIILLKDKNWLAITRKADTAKEEINNILKKDNFLNSNLELKNKNLEVWSKITTDNNEKHEIKENIGAIIEENEDMYIWSQDLSSISNFDNKKYLLTNFNNDNIEDKNNDFDNAIRIHLDKKQTELLLNNFYPYILLRAMTGSKLDVPQNIDISLSIPTINYTDFIKFKVNLKTS